MQEKPAAITERKGVPLWLVAVLCVAGIVAAITLSDPDRSDRNQQPNKAESLAITAAQELVKQRLKAPSTAVFQPREEWVVSRDGDGWLVSAWVESKNAFGVPLRQTFAAKVVHDGGNWRLSGLRFGE